MPLIIVITTYSEDIIKFLICSRLSKAILYVWNTVNNFNASHAAHNWGYALALHSSTPACSLV